MCLCMCAHACVCVCGGGLRGEGGVCVCTCVCVRVNGGVRVHKYVWVWVCIACACLCVCVCARALVCVFVVRVGVFTRKMETRQFYLFSLTNVTSTLSGTDTTNSCRNICPPSHHSLSPRTQWCYSHIRLQVSTGPSECPPEVTGSRYCLGPPQTSVSSINEHKS